MQIMNIVEQLNQGSSLNEVIDIIVKIMEESIFEEVQEVLEGREKDDSYS